MRRLYVLLPTIIWCWLPASATAQGKLYDQPHPVDLVITVSVDRSQNPAPAGVRVEIYNEFGDATPVDVKTDGSGRVEIRIMSGSHRIRISGPGIEEYNGAIEIEYVETRRNENITVRSKSSENQFSTNSVGNPGVVSASRLKVPTKAEAEFQRGSKALTRKDYLEALKRFEAATAIYPAFDMAYNGMGVANMATGHANAARQSFEKAIQLNDHFAEAYRNLARICLAERRYDEMDDLLTTSLGIDPLNAWALAYAAYAELQTSKFDLAIAHARAAHSIPHEGLASVHIVAADALEAIMQPAEALDQYRIYLKEDPRGPDAVRAEKAVTRLSGVLGK